MKIAYLIIAHKDIEQVYNLIDTLDNENSFFFIHLKKSYQVSQSEMEHGIKLDVSDFSHRTYVNVSNKGNIWVQGKDTPLKDEFEKLIIKFKSDPVSYIKKPLKPILACSTKYDIMLNEYRKKIKEKLSSIVGTLKIVDEPEALIQYRAKIDRNSFSITFTQFNNGTLLLQGKEDNLFNESCDLVEKIANPSDGEVIARFISNNEENLKLFTAKYSPELINMAEKNVIKKVGDAYNYLESYDKKWLVASECLCLTKIPLPEYSPMVMPASKAFEGFAKKTLIGIGLFPSGHFSSKTANFSFLNDKNHPNRISVCLMEKYVDTKLKQISLDLERYRNFMMHSDDSKVTKVETVEKAVHVVDEIFNEIKDLFNYFNDNFSLMPK